MQLDDTRRADVLARLRRFYLDEFDQELSAFRAERLLAFCLEAIGPTVYNQGVQDARGFVLRKLEDLDVEVYAPERE